MERPTDDPLGDHRIRRRVDVLAPPRRAGRTAPGAAAPVPALPTRQVRRLLASWLSHGPAGLVHGNHGRAPANRTATDVRNRIAELTRGKDEDVNRAHP